MKRLIAFAAALLVNVIALGVIAAGIDESSLPRGQVVITELTSQGQVMYALAGEHAHGSAL